MSSIDKLFTDLRAAGKTALMPFITAGDPDTEFTRAVVTELFRRGCHLCEVGIPYSDPIADGPVIQASYTRALEAGFQLQAGLAMIGRLAQTHSGPLVTMVSYAIVHRRGVQRYVAEAQAAGVAGAIVPDLPVEESTALASVCRKADFSLIQLVTPTTPRARAVRIAETSTGFLYFVSITGITGERQELPAELVDNVGWLRSHTDLPICVGFGISRPEHVRLLAPVADGLIVGSAIVRRLATAATRPRALVIREVGDFVATLLAALDD